MITITYLRSKWYSSVKFHPRINANSFLSGKYQSIRPSVKNGSNIFVSHLKIALSAWIQKLPAIISISIGLIKNRYLCILEYICQLFKSCAPALPSGCHRVHKLLKQSPMGIGVSITILHCIRVCYHPIARWRERITLLRGDSLAMGRTPSLLSWLVLVIPWYWYWHWYLSIIGYSF